MRRNDARFAGQKSEEIDRRFEATDRRFKQVADLFMETDSFIRTLAQIAQHPKARLHKLAGGSA